MIDRQPMTTSEFAAFLESSIAMYAEDNVAAGRWTREEALEQSRAEHEKLVPQGIHTPDQYLFLLRDGPGGPKVGELWYAVRREGAAPFLWIYWIGIDAPYRRKGFASEALRSVEPDARRLGVGRVGLHVFGSNDSARSVYRSLGYVETNVVMSKDLSKGP
jgi:RimJ/RimL family protein N-acetyltransferase